MPVKTGVRKSQIIAVRVTPRIKEMVVQIARSEGLDVSEWVRSLIIGELRRRGFLSPTLASLRDIEGL